MDENNQYGNEMTKPLPTGSIKRKKISNKKEFDLIVQGILDEKKTGSLFVVNIHFEQKMPAKNNCSLTKYIPIFEKKKVLSANERSVFQLYDAMRLNDKGTINSFKTIAKTHATMDEKNCNSA